MTKLENKQKISSIIMHPTASTKCVIGQDWFHNELEIDFLPSDCYPDYMEVEAFVMRDIDGHDMNVEEVVQTVFDFLSLYHPRYLKVTDHIHGCKSHFDVDVTKTSDWI